MTGHRTPRLPRSRHFELQLLATRLMEELAESTNHAVELWSPLAVGADQILADAAFTAQIPVVGLLPFRREDYAQDFEPGLDRETFGLQVSACLRIIQLPGNHRNIQTRNDAYASLADHLVHAVDGLIAVWDGKPAAGPGGTAEVVSLAEAVGVPMLTIGAGDPVEFRNTVSGPESPVRDLFCAAVVGLKSDRT